MRLGKIQGRWMVITGIVIIAILIFAVLPQIAPRNHNQTICSISDMETKAQDIMDDGTLISYTLYSDNEKTVSVYLQKAEIYGENNRMSYVIYHSDDKDILLQGASLSLPEYVFCDDDFIYICGRTTAFSTTEGINVTRYRCTEDCVVIENAINEKSLSDGYYIYQDETNEALVSIMPTAQDGMGRIYFEKVERSEINATEVIGSKVSKVTFINNKGIFVLDVR